MATPSPASSTAPPKVGTSEGDLRLEAKRLKLEQLKVRQLRLENRLRYLASRQARRDETRRKILIGAVILAKIERGGVRRKEAQGDARFCADPER